MLYLCAIQKVYRGYFVIVSGGRCKGRKDGESPQIHQAHAAIAIGARTQMTRTKHAISAAIFKGAMQYPRTHKPWKNELREQSTECTSPDPCLYLHSPSKQLEVKTFAKGHVESASRTYLCLDSHEKRTNRDDDHHGGEYPESLTCRRLQSR